MINNIQFKIIAGKINKIPEFYTIFARQMLDYIIRQRDWGEAEAKILASRPPCPRGLNNITGWSATEPWRQRSHLLLTWLQKKRLRYRLAAALVHSFHEISRYICWWIFCTSLVGYVIAVVAKAFIILVTNAVSMFSISNRNQGTVARGHAACQSDEEIG